MKKFYVLAIVASGFFFASCEREYTCECTMTTIYPADMAAYGMTDETLTVSATKTGKKNDVKDWCEAENGTIEMEDMKITTDCKIK